MKKLLLIFWGLLCFFKSKADDLNKQQQSVVRSFVDCIKKKNVNKLSDKISFPLNREYPIPAIKNKKEFIENYNLIFDEAFVKKIVSSNINKDWSAAGWRGIMFNNGDLWLNEDGDIISIHYQSTKEKTLKEELIKKEKELLHSSIKNFIKPICVLQTKQFKIRIDEIKEGVFRYSAWKTSAQMSEKPTLILFNGVYIPDGNGGNYKYEFKKDNYIYECNFVLMGEENEAPANLTVYKNDTQVLFQEAKIL